MAERAISEDELSDRLVRYYQDDLEIDPSDIHTDEPFTYDGDQEVVDIFVDTDWYQHLCELKSQSAVESATSADEIVNQVNRMVDSFFDETEYEESYDEDGEPNIRYELCFTPSPDNLEHVLENASVYGSLKERAEIILITMRFPDAGSIAPLHLFTPQASVDDGEKWWTHHVKPLLDRIDPVMDVEPLHRVIETS